MKIEEFLRNREQLPMEELEEYDGKWVAISADGARIIAGADTIADLENVLAEAGIDPQTVGFERIELDDLSLGGAELL